MERDEAQDLDWQHGWRHHWRGGAHGMPQEEIYRLWAHWHARHRHMGWRHRLHHKLHARFRHSLGARLTRIFLFLATMGSVGSYLALQHQVNWLWLLPGILLLTLLAYGSIRHMLYPLRALAHGAATFGRGELSHRIQVYHRDEIGALAGRFNRMADDIQAMLDAKRGLLLAISHELRSPLTRARLNAELIDEGPSQQAVIKELAMMRDLIESLLERERLDLGHSALSLEACDVRTLVQDLLASRFDEAVGQGLLRADLAPDLPASIELDKPRVQLLIGNLLDNALRHHDPKHGQPVVLAISMEQGAEPNLHFSVRDWGPGVEDDELSKLGQPFYRPDSARTRRDGGVGLGLNLCFLIVAAHGGEMVLRQAQPGLEVSVKLPV